MAWLWRITFGRIARRSRLRQLQLRRAIKAAVRATDNATPMAKALRWLIVLNAGCGDVKWWKALAATAMRDKKGGA